MSNSIEILFNTSEITAGTRGASLGPGAILTAARKIGDTFFSNYPLNWLEDVNERLNQPPVFQYAKYIDGLTTIVDQLSVSIQDIIEKNNFPLVIAADHGSAAGTILGLKKKYPSKRLGVIWVDAHGDLHTPYTTPSGNMHGMPLAIALNEDNKDCQRNELPDELIRKWNDLKSRSGETAIKSEDLFFVGVRDTEPEEDFLIEKHKIRNFKIEEIRQGGVESLKIEL
ncbi:MAG: arginase family protein, partial [Bacteroidetes bacterium]|nr:arginase family protein [Bacteroidota bacterium]